MSLLTDINEFLKEFRNVGPRMKFLLTLLFIPTVTHVTSLADDVFKWKGFILQGLKTYHEYLVSPLVSFSSSIGMKFDQNEIHAAVLATLSVGIGMHLLAAGQIVAFNRINERYKSELKPNLNYLRIVGYLFPIGTWCWYGFTEQNPNFWVIGPMFIFYPLLLVVPKILMTKERAQNNFPILNGEGTLPHTGPDGVQGQ